MPSPEDRDPESLSLQVLNERIRSLVNAHGLEMQSLARVERLMEGLDSKLDRHLDEANRQWTQFQTTTVRLDTELKTERIERKKDTENSKGALEGRVKEHDKKHSDQLSVTMWAVGILAAAITAVGVVVLTHIFH